MLQRLKKKRFLWLTFLAVVLPMALLLTFQYRWLTSLAETSAIAERAALSNYIEAVSTQVEYFYRRQAERSLNIPSDYFYDVGIDKIAWYFKRKEPEGAKLFFAIKYTPAEWGEFRAYDPRAQRLGEPEDPATMRAILVATAPWKLMADKGSAILADSFLVDERDPENRIVLHPVTLGPDGRVIGITGMVVDNEYFVHDVLEASIERALPNFFSDDRDEDLAIAVQDGGGSTVFGEERVESAAVGEVVERPFPFIYSDWTLSIGSRSATPEQVAKSNFLLNMSLSVLLAVLLLGGIFFTLQTASREMTLSQMKSDFVSNVSHELRTPLASIRVFGEFLRLGRTSDPEKIREYGEYIETESRRLTRLVNNILDFSKIESGAKTYDLQPADLADLVGRTIRTLSVSLRHKGFDLRYEPPERPLPAVAVDRNAVGQALANLIDNAVKYSGDARQVRVALREVGGAVHVDVEDDGVGISPDEQTKIFDRFHRVSTGLVHDVKGSGLGLSIVSHVAQAHGGRVLVDSEPGRGSRFTLVLPVPESSAPSSATPHPHDPAAAPGGVR